MSTWQECQLGEIAEVQTGPFGSQLKNEQYITGGTPVVTVEHINNFRINNFNYPSVTDKDRNRLSRYLLNEGDIIFTRVGSVDLSAYVKSHQQGWMFSSRMLRVRPKKNIDARFLSYFFQQKSFRDYVLNIAVGATMPSINTGILKGIPISYPALPEQKAIASVLSSLDDKIDLLHRQNKTLEAIAVTLFRQWIVEEAQEGWEEVVITDLFEVRDGTHDSPKQASIGKPLITSKHILDGRLDIGNAYLISNDDFNQVNQRSKVDIGDILFSMIGTIGLLYLEQSLSVDYAIKNIGLFKTSQNPDWALYTYLWLISSNGRQFIDEHKSGSTQEYVSLGSLRSIVFQKPPINVLQSFNKLASGYFSKMILNRSQIRTLEKLRDTLLPKLMSGEVRVA